MKNLRATPFSYNGIKSLFSGIDFSSDTAVSSTQLIYSFLSIFFISLFILLSLLIYIFSNRSLGTFFHEFRIPFPWFRDSVSVSGLPIPCFSAAVLLYVLISKTATLNVHTFMYISLPLFCTTTTWRRCRTSSRSLFFTAAYFHFVLVAASISHVITAATKFSFCSSN